MHFLWKSLPLLILAAFNAMPTASQKTISSPRIVDKIDESHLVTLRGNTPPLANMKGNLGQLSATMPMTDLILVLSRDPEQQAAFDAFVASQYDNSSPNYHRWLEPTEIGEKFGPSLADIATVSSWLTGHGLSVDGVSKDRMTIRFSGSAAHVEAAFHTQIHKLMVGGEPHFSNMTDPQIPMALQPVVQGPKALHDFLPRPLHRLGGKAILNTQNGNWERVPGRSPVESSVPEARLTPQPDLGINQGVGANTYVIEDVTPHDFATIYNVRPLWNNSIDGTGQTIAIAGRSNVRPTDVASFRSIFGLPAGIFNTIHNGPDPGYCTGATGLCTLMDQVENALDVELAGAVAKGAAIKLVVTQQTATNDAVYESASYVITNKTAPILSVSYGLCELFLGTSGNAAYNSLWQTASAEGIAVFVASGDAGAPACDQGQSSTTPYTALFGLSVNGVASSPFDTVVGGTDFTWCNPSMNVRCTTGTPYWKTTNSTSTGANAQSYIPEVPWNDTCTTPAAIAYIKSVSAVAALGTVTDAESACNFINDYYPTIIYRYNINLSSLVNIKGTGGGPSSCTASDGSNVTSCSAGHAKPGWQKGVAGIPNDGKRDLPDVSFFAGTGFWNSAYLICVSDIGTCLTDTSPVYRPTGGEVGGTSVGTPAMAGVMALINQKAGAAQGNPNSELYELAKLQSYSRCRSEGGSTSNGCIFNDIDYGTNAMACTAGSPDCVVAMAGDKLGVLSGYGASTGYDMATGLGSLNVANLVNAWPSSSIVTPTITVAPSSRAIKVSDSVNVSVAVQGSNGTATGAVTLSGGGYSSSAQTLSSGSTTFTIPANTLSAGTDTLTANYSGDSNYAAASGTTIITVTAVKLTPTLVVTPSSTSIKVDQSLNVSVTVHGSSNTPTGSVTLSGGGYTSSQSLSSGSTTFIIPANTLSAGTDTLTVNYSGDSTYAAASGTTIITVTAVKLMPALAVTASSNSITRDQSLHVNVAVTGSGVTPTGTVTLRGGGYTSSATTLSARAASFTIPANTLSIGTDTLTASYGGDDTYSSGTETTTVTVCRLTPSLTVSPDSNSIHVGQSLNVEVTVSGPAETPTGTVTLSSGGYASSTQPLSAGMHIFTIPAGALAVGSDKLTILYGGDSVYLNSSASTDVTVAPSTYGLVSSIPPAISRGGSATSAITVSSNDGYSGTVTLTCSLTSSPSGATLRPVCTVDSQSSTITLSSTCASGTGKVTVTTAAASTALIERSTGLFTASGTMLASLVLLVLPRRRSTWRAFLIIVLLLTSVASIGACGGGSSNIENGGGGGSGDSGTTVGTYTFTVSGTSNPAISPTPNTVFSVTVN